MAKVVASVAVLLVLLVAVAESGPVVVCCTQYQPNPINIKRLRDYTIQKTDYCNLKAVIFRTVRGKYACGNPEQKWVQEAMAKLPRRA